MAIAVTTDLVDVNLSEATTNYAVLGTWATSIAVSPDTYVQANNTVGGRVSAATNYAHTTLPGAPVDLSINERHIFQWLKCISIPQLDSKANGGLAITMSSDATPTLVGSSPNDGLSNGKTWFVGGKDDALSGWVCYVVDPLSTPNPGVLNGTANAASVRRIGIRAKVVGTVGSGSVKPVNIVFDATRYGTGLSYTGDNAGTPGAFADILTTAMSSNAAWGILTSDSSIYFGAGKFTFGNTTQAAVSSFKSTGDTFVWRFFPVAATFYEWSVLGAASFKTTFQLGDYSGGLVSNGTTVKGAGDPSTANHATWTMDIGINTIVNLYGSAFSEMRRAVLQANTTVRGCTFKNFGDITPNGAVINDCTFQDVKTTAPISGTHAIVLHANTEIYNKITGCTFINCKRAIEINANGTYVFDNLKFAGNEYDIENNATGAVIIEAVNTANPSTFINTAGGSVTINNPKTLAIAGLTAGSEINVYRVSDLYNYANTASSGTSWTWNYNADATPIFITVCKPGLKWIRFDNLTLDANGVSLYVQQQTDFGYNNPA